METYEHQTDSGGAPMGLKSALHIWEIVVKLGIYDTRK